MIRSMRSSMQLGKTRVFIVPAVFFSYGRSISSLTGHGGFMHDVLVHQLVLWVFLFNRSLRFCNIRGFERKSMTNKLCDCITQVRSAPCLTSTRKHDLQREPVHMQRTYRPPEGGFLQHACPCFWHLSQHLLACTCLCAHL